MEKKLFDFWNKTAVLKGYKPLTIEEFQAAITHNPHFNPDYLYVYEVMGELKGAALACIGDYDDIPYGRERAYITFIVFDDEYEDEEHVGAALNFLEGKAREAGKSRLDFSFFNPMRLSWCMAGLNGHEHNNRPGVLLSSKLFDIMSKAGYDTVSTECSMHMDITSYEMPPEMKEREKALREKGITIDYYFENPVTGVDEFLNRLNNPLWSIQIPDSLRKKEPVIFVSDNGKAAGFTGPTIREPSGRGYFLGVAVDEAYRGMGIGTLLFHKLCEGFKRVGVTYVTLFTGKTNKALDIYKKVGFSVEEEFATMKKEL